MMELLHAFTLPMWAWWLLLLAACVTPIGRRLFGLVINLALLITAMFLDVGKRFG